MLGAIAGDIIGSVYETDPIKTKEFELFCPTSRFTDDTVLTIAVADVLLTGGEYAPTFRDYYHRFPDKSYGSGFSRWAESTGATACNSYGNGSAMRVSPIGWAYNSLTEVMIEAKRSAQVSHNHHEGVKGAQAVATAIFLARSGQTKAYISEYLTHTFHYNLDRSLDEIRPDYTFDTTCQGTVPEAVIAFLNSNSHEDAIRNAISLGGDSDTMACIAGAIAEAYYKEIDIEILNGICARLPDIFINVTMRFINKYCHY